MRRNNLIRAAWALAAIETFAEQTGQDTSGDLEHEQDSVIGDLLANLRHYCEACHLDFDALLATSLMHYEAEQSNDEDSWELDGEPLVRPRKRKAAA